MKKLITALFLVFLVSTFTYSQQDGDNMLFGVPKIAIPIRGTDTITNSAGRSIEFVPGSNSLDGDGLAAILVPEYYSNSGRINVFKQVAKNSLDFKLVWSTAGLKKKSDGTYPSNPYSMPRMSTYCDIDGNGKKEIVTTFGRKPNDPFNDTTWARGLYFYESLGNNTYTEPPCLVKMSDIDSFSNSVALLTRQDRGGILWADANGDGKEELLVGSFDFGFNKDVRKSPSKVYVLKKKSGSVAGKDLKLDTLYVYHGMAKCEGDTDGYATSGIQVADIDGDGKPEVAVIGQKLNAKGGAMGFFKCIGNNQWVDGSVVNLATSETDNLFGVCFQIAKYRYQGKDLLFLNTDDYAYGTATKGRLLMLSDVIDISLVSSANFTVLGVGDFGWCGTAVGNQDHGTGTDGFDIYTAKSSSAIYDLEYNGTGNIADSNSYKQYTIFREKQLYKKANGGIYHIIAPTEDINGNGRKEIICNVQIGGADTLVNGNVYVPRQSPFIILEWGDTAMGTVGVQTFKVIMPEDYKLEQNYPNPFNPTTTIKFTLPAPENLNMTIYDINGREVKKIIEGKHYETGSHEVTWDARDNSGKPVSSGVYIYKMSWGNFEKSLKMTLLK